MLDILIVVLDDVGVDRVSAYGSPDAPTTPTIDALADEGLRFDRAWAMPTCSPTRAALMTGRLPHRNGVGAVILARQPHELPLREVTLAEMLRRADEPYSLAALGKWHLSAQGSLTGAAHALEQGFDRFAGSLNNLDAAPSLEGDPARSYVSWERVGFDGQTTLSHDFATTDTIDDAIASLQSLQEPWFLYVAFNAAHRPLMAPPEALFDGPLDPADEPALFDANVVAADRELGRLIDALGEAKEHTLIVVLGDNGTPSYATGQAESKGTFTEGGLRVPLIVSGPPVTARGHTDALVHVMDLYPTLMELTGVQRVGRRLDGTSLVPVFEDPNAAVHDRIYSELRHPAAPPWTRLDQAARDATLKVVDEGAGPVIYRIDGTTERPVDESTLTADERSRVQKLEAELRNHPD